ncbi:TPA: saccharopine dehydrogenase NADP-binding domain-containing protein [Burkholderia multivorans]|uniref:saccharopine dehydrogenase family protein n=1 Tax=Burkholderia multivorans TaxID=87883 RepID=UPI000CFF8B71|nr:saccharopine dehydrogenase NADP-binding domain-containing protein [Burkholderia multivorans]MBU9300909.1 saccharopine dehydrogenase NADP-binding domain-containing protein [Burkholderia multivorans]MBU9302359.1 saccharopine dehydrogenase NADP-binding domain-containing protein [Burkholderia multivorans]MBU9407293.1 saccharopine dehydrogenase NADP-binding domain-containing protein [Burkholderia multivorans]MBU9498692.1 saccharopine dehydrogenase NADP-binding domain-containing protein [Burkholde
MSKALMIYGAYGYTGELVVREAVRQGMRPIIAGRDGRKLKPLADAFGLEARAFEVANAKANLENVAVVLNCAGPFSTTAVAFVEACIDSHVHYVDITGEIPVFQFCHAQHLRAAAAGIVLCPGAGFDIVPTDSLAAALKERKPDATRIDLAFSFGTKPSIGTVKTILESAASGGLVRRNHRLVSVPNAWRIRRIPFPGGARWGVSIPWGDVFTAGVSTGVPDGLVYCALPLTLGLTMRLTNFMRGLFAVPAVSRVLDRLARRFFAGGPDAGARDVQRTAFWAEAINAWGETVTITMSAPNVYAMTADTSLAIANRCLTEPVPAGYRTPSMLMGSAFFLERPGFDVSYPGGAGVGRSQV